MQQAGCKLEEDIRTEVIMRCYVEARQPDMVLATLQDFIDGGGEVSGSRVLADAEQVGLVVSKAKRLPRALPYGQPFSHLLPPSPSQLWHCWPHAGHAYVCVVLTAGSPHASH